MKTNVIPVYSCDFCKKKLFRQSAMTRHEFECGKNPKNFAQCHDCTNCEKIKVDYYQDGIPMQADGFSCIAFNQEMYPFKAVKKGLVKKYPETFKDKFQMPSKDCGHYSQIDLQEFFNRLT